MHKPILYMSLRRRSAGVMIFIAWLVATIMISPVFIQEFIHQSNELFFKNRNEYFENSTVEPGINFKMCFTADLDEILPGLNISNIIVNFFSPIAVIGICYSFVFVKIKQKIDRKVAAKMEQLEMMTCSTRLMNQQVIMIMVYHLIQHFHIKSGFKNNDIKA